MIDFFKKNNLNGKGFTLIELLLVITVIAVLAVIVLISLKPIQRFADSRNAQRYMDIDNILKAINLYTIENNTEIPELDGALRMLGTATSGCAVTCGNLVQLHSGNDNLVERVKQYLKRKSTVHAVSDKRQKERPPGDEPLIKSARAFPSKVIPGDILTVEVEIEDKYGVDHVSADMGSLEKIELDLIRGDENNGTWRAAWRVHDTVDKRYVTRIEARNHAGRSATRDIFWWDPPSSGWVNPTGFEDPGNQWVNETNAFDDNTGTYATNQYGGSGWGQYLVLTLDSPITSDRLRLNVDYLDAHIEEVDVDVYTDGAWQDVFQGGNEEDWNVQWIELTYGKGQVEKARFRYNYKVSGYYYWFFELQFYQASSTIGLPQCGSKPATAIRANSALLQGQVIDDGGEPNQYRFQYGLTSNYSQNTGWESGKVSGEVFKQSITGLSGMTGYHFRAQLKNSVGTVNCSDQEFTTEEEGIGWTLPTTYSDPSNKWESEADIMDDDTTTFGRSYHNIGDPQWSSFVYFNHPGINSNKLRIYALYNSESNAVDVDVYKDGVWEDVYQGAFSDRQWVEYSYSEGNITQARVRFYTNYANHGFFWELYDFSFWGTGSQDAEVIISDECLDLSEELVTKYLSKIPYDPHYGSPERTYYAVKKEFGDRKITVVACRPEEGEQIQVSN